MSSLAKLFVPAVLTAGAVFSAFAIPLTLYGSHPLAIQLKEERVFEGPLRDVAPPYLAIAGFLSFGTSLTVCAALGWRRAIQDAEFADAQLLAAEKQLKQKEAQLQDTLMSEAYLTDSGLKFFLDEDMPIPTAGAAKSVILQPTTPTHREKFSTNSMSQARTTAPLHAAQAYLGFSRPTSAAQPSTASNEADAIAKMQNLQSQLQQIMAEIETIQSTLRVESTSPSATATNAPLNHLAQRFQALDPAWTVQK
ncbi:MAG: TIGR03761 family integrating conjugative element protein [Leptolyngbya sp. Prado105]|jgi:hypothetical protein|nr:TIGR03761 family integrating conjugative element protein [Leptolyngbya sp. Prado105]